MPVGPQLIRSLAPRRLGDFEICRVHGRLASTAAKAAALEARRADAADGGGVDAIGGGVGESGAIAGAGVAAAGDDVSMVACEGDGGGGTVAEAGGQAAAEAEQRAEQQALQALQQEVSSLQRRGLVGTLGKSDGGSHGVQYLSHGDIKLAEFKQMLARSGYVAEFQGGMLRVNNAVTVRRDGQHQLLVEGAYGQVYTAVRRMLYEQFQLV